METILEGGLTTSWLMAWRYGKGMGTLPHYFFPESPWIFFYQERRRRVKTIVMEHFNGILFHKSGPANKHHIYQLIFTDSLQ